MGYYFLIISELKIRRLHVGEAPPYDLLLLADPSRELVDYYLKDSSCFVLEKEEKIIGVAVLLERENQKAEIMNIAVSEEFQGRGLGKKIILEIIDYARSQGVVELMIGTGNSSIHQLALYQKCGFRMSSIERDFFIKNYPEPITENGIPCVDMIRLTQKL